MCLIIDFIRITCIDINKFSREMVEIVIKCITELSFDVNLILYHEVAF